MRTALSIGIVAFLAACAGAAPRPQSEEAPEGRWQGFLLRNGQRERVSVELTEASSVWDGRLSAGDNFLALEDVRVSGSNVHFELPGEGAFDGAVAGNSMAGSVSGPVSGSFSLMRVDSPDWSPYFLGP
jgi:hypothetical protein